MHFLRADLLLFGLSLVSCVANAQVLLDESGSTGEERFTIDLAGVDREVIVTIVVQSREGSGRVVLLDSEDNEIFSDKPSLLNPIITHRIAPGSAGGHATLVFEYEDALGSYQARAAPAPPRALLVGFVFGGMAMVLVGAVPWIWWWRTRERQLRWFWAGAGLWVISVAAKFAIALPLNRHVISALNDVLPEPASTIAGSIYIGGLTGITEILFVIGAAFTWRGLSSTYARAIAIGIGAGGIEAILLGVNPAIQGVMALFDTPTGDLISVVVSMQSAATPLLWAAGPVERMLTIPMHVGSRCLCLYGIASKKIWPLVAGFVLLSGVDATAGYAHLSGYVATGNSWIIEAAIVPFTILGFLAAYWLRNRWPRPVEPTSSVDEVENSF